MYLCLIKIWHATSKIGDEKTINTGNKIASQAFPWEIDILAREIILNCVGTIQPPEKRHSKQKFDLELCIKYIRKASALTSEKTVKSADDAFKKLHAIFHQQIPWQDDNFIFRFVRYAKIMEHGPLKEIVENRLKISIQDLYKIGLAVAGSIRGSAHILSSNYSQTPGIKPGADISFFKITADSIEDIKERAVANQINEEEWQFAFNPLREKPLIFDKGYPEKILGISQQFLIWRITSGIYYDIRQEKEFSEAWGDAFENYIGDVLKEALPHESFKIIHEAQYKISKGKERLGADWRLIDATGLAFIECKTKRLTIKSQINFDGETLSFDINKLADAVIQNYKNINDAKEGKIPDFEVGELPICNVVVTLENWRIENPAFKKMLNDMVVERLTKECLDKSLLETCPYRIYGSQQFEMIMQDVSRNGVFKTLIQNEGFNKGPYRQLFEGTLTRLIPELDPMPDGTLL